MSLRHLSKPLVLIPLLLGSIGCDSDDEGNRVLIGNANTFFELGELQYQEQFAVQVSKADGAPSANASVTISLSPLSYNKGQYLLADIDVPPDGELDLWAPNVSVVCPSEDLNNNGALDAGEDVNGNGVLEPTVPTLTPHPDETPTIAPGSNVIATDENGFGYFAIAYPKSEGSWSSVLVTAEASDGLPGNTAVYTLDLRVLIKDVSDLAVNPPGGVPSPYGTASDCTDPN